LVLLIHCKHSKMWNRITALISRSISTVPARMNYIDIYKPWKTNSTIIVILHISKTLIFSFKAELYIREMNGKTHANNFKC
jgi:disulfide oxidoreductase YuzD